MTKEEINESRRMCARDVRSSTREALLPYQTELFLSHARTALPAALDEIERLRARLVETLEDAISREYNAFEPDNQSRRYLRLRDQLNEIKAQQ